MVYILRLGQFPHNVTNTVRFTREFVVEGVQRNTSWGARAKQRAASETRYLDTVTKNSTATCQTFGFTSSVEGTDTGLLWSSPPLSFASPHRFVLAASRNARAALNEPFSRSVQCPGSPIQTSRSANCWGTSPLSLELSSSPAVSLGPPCTGLVGRVACVKAISV